MTRIKIDYGIDLGTTNSSICRMEKGEPVIIKTDTLKETLPSCVSFTKKGSIKVGDGAYNTMKSDKRRVTKNWMSETTSTFTEFKRTMGTDALYASPYTSHPFSSEELSAEVLKTLKSFVMDESIHSVVITVPAKFTVGQKTATIQAAHQAGFDHCELLQEPIAAAFAYGLSAEQKTGIWMVFDFGGGTFDAALLKAEEGILQVFDTAGDNYLGGKDLDTAIVDKIIIPYLRTRYSIEEILNHKERNAMLRDAMKTFAEEVKNQLSFKTSEDILSNLGDLGVDDEGEEIELDMTVSQSELFEVMRPIFQKAVNICLELLKRNGLNGDDVDRIILIGGPTYSPLIRQMLREQITPNIDTSINPMTAVATGAALYASTLDAAYDISNLENENVMLDVNYEETTVETSEWVSVKLSDNQSDETYYNGLQIEVTRADWAWSSGKIDINTVGEALELQLNENKPNTFYVTCYNEKGVRLSCFPSEFTIIQGTKSPLMPLPYNIGIAIWEMEKQKLIFKAAKGLEKNKTLPAIGAVNGLYTSTPLRPGLSNDILTIPVYQCEDNPSIERSATLYEYVADIIVTGEEVRSLIPDNSLVDITLRVDTSEQMTMEIYFPSADFTVSKNLDTSKRQSVQEAETQIPRMLHDAWGSLNRLKELGVETRNLETELCIMEESAKNNPEKKAVLQHLKEILRKIEDRDIETEWIRVEKSIEEYFKWMESVSEGSDSCITKELLHQLYLRKKQIMLSKNVAQGKAFLEQLEELYAQNNLLYICMKYIKDCQKSFREIQWKDAHQAQYLINQGIQIISNSPSVEQLHPIVLRLVELAKENSDIPFLH